MSRRTVLWAPGQPIPDFVTDADLRAMLGLGKSRYFLLKAQGRYRFLEVKPQIEGTNTLYSGSKIRDWRDGKLDEPRFFRSHLQPRHPRPGRPRKTTAPQVLKAVE